MDCKGVHILFCDQNPSTGSETLALLRKCSYTVTVVKSAHEVVEVVKSAESDVDIVLMDVELPQEKGFKVLKHIMRQDNLSHIAVVVMSEQDEMAVVAKCLRLGAVDYLVKPLRLNEVMNLWTHMWRRRRMLGLPEKHAVHERISFLSSLRKPDTTRDLLSSYNSRERLTSVLDTGPKINSRDEKAPLLELSLRLSSNYNAEKMLEQVGTHSFPGKEIALHSSPFSLHSRASNQQPDEQSANECSPSSPPSKRTKFLNEQCLSENREFPCKVHPRADPSLGSSKDSIADENRPGDMESQLCDAPVPRQMSVHCYVTPDEKRFHIGQIPATHTQNHQPCYGFFESPPTDMHQQGFTVNLQEVCATGGYGNPMLHAPQANIQQPLPYHCHNGLVNVPSVPNVFSYYPVPHLAVPVMSFSTWPTMVPSPSAAEGKIIQAERREAALSKFRLKRKGRCFEKKIRYASRKMLAEQRPRIRGQFVKRTVVAENPANESGCDEEEGEADDEQGCSELDNSSSPDCMAQNCRADNSMTAQRVNRRNHV